MHKMDLCVGGDFRSLTESLFEPIEVTMMVVARGSQFLEANKLAPFLF